MNPGTWPVAGATLAPMGSPVVDATPADGGWTVTVEDVDPERERVQEAVLALADGCVGVTGAPLLGSPGARPVVITAGVYDGQGPETHLVVAPTPWRLPGELTPDATVSRRLDLRHGVLHEHVDMPGGGVDSIRFASLTHPGLLALHAHCPSDPRSSPPLTSTDDPAVETGMAEDVHWARVKASYGGVTGAAADSWQPTEHGGQLRRLAVYVADRRSVPDIDGAVTAVRAATAAGFERLLGEHREAWAARWDAADVALTGDDDLQRATRFALFHLIASVSDRDEAAVGARGLSGQGYRGHVFWDADTFVLPFLAATHPPAARAMLEYRLRRLPAAQAHARRGARKGARFPWESAATGDDVTPTSARDRSGGVVPIRTGQLEDHITADVAWAAQVYCDWTGDMEFASGPGLRLLVETARYWASRIRVDPAGLAHIYGVIGPDEYHEPVDDNAFTNVMARWNLRRAAEAAETVGPEDVSVAECRRWRALADALVDGYDPQTGLYEQCAGFYGLEPLIIAEVAPRRPIAADLLLGADRVHGAQVIKQADVLMLHHLVPHEVAPESLEPNLRFYEPRTAHGSSLSPAIHAALLARARQYDQALEALRMASRIDLEDLTGSTALGLHVATMGGLWQALVFGFAGIRPGDGQLHIDPRLPPAWGDLDVNVRFHGSAVYVHVEHAAIRVTADPPAPVTIDGVPHTASPGGVELRFWNHRWGVVP